ncbi:Spt20 family-domain-containing protein [Phaeosphaeria sp. MPI-PUGE-AT-0046c]|nr:Spt20 family-domain-containing protein [Phaeosphaeria sp. MPI-PUGE-AT-0046c]
MSGPVATARPTQALRLRRESQRPGVARSAARPANMEDETAKQDVRRYVYTQQDILNKHKGKPPSLRIFLHPKHFRLNDSTDMLEYSSPMREILQHLKTKTVPHNMVEDFYGANVPFYDNCLIVEVHDLRSTGVKPRDDTNSLGDSGTSAFSIHNYNNFITPSPHAPYPSNNKADAKTKQPEPLAKEASTTDDKENKPASAQNGAAQKQAVKANIWTTVLFPTPQSQYADMQLLATTPMPDPATLKRMQAAGRAAGMPPTPMTAVPPTPTFSAGPSPKRQKMVIDDSNIHEFESEVYNATCPKLYLEPTKSFAQSQALMDAITHANNKNEAPSRKTRKRTTAELQADEAEAAATQRFMLAGDEQQANMTATATGGDEGGVRAIANTQNFSRLKTLATIKANHEEADRRKKEEDARVAQAKRAQVEMEAQKKRDMEFSKQQAEHQERQQLLLRQQAAQQQQLQQNQMQQNEALRAATQAQQMANATAVQMSQTPQSATQPQFSPVVQNGTPMAAAASPRVGGQASHTMGGTPMVATASNHAIASPARPPSVVSHQQMARSASQQQNLSRTGTPQMVQGTPVMNSAMPNRNMTPTPVRMNQGSPSMAMQGATPIMMHTPGQNMTPEHMQQLQNQQMMQQRMLQQQQIQQGGASPGMSQLQQLAISKAAQHIQQNGIPQGQNPQQYQQTLARRFFQNLTQQQQQQQQQQAQQQRALQNMSPQGNQAGMTPGNNMPLQQLRQHHQQRKMQLIQQYGPQGIPQPEMMRLRQLENAIVTRQQAEQQSQMQMMNGNMQGQMQGQMQNQMNGMPNGGIQANNPIQMQAYQQMLQQQRANQARNQQMMAMRQQHLQQGGQLPQGMINNVNMQGMNMGNMQGMNMQNVQGMSMQNMQAMQAMQGMQGMQGMNMSQMNQQQVQQMMMMRQAQQQAQMQRQPGQQGGGDMGGWTG